MVAAVFRLRDALECMYCGAARQATERGIHSLSSGREQSRSSTSLPGLRSRLRGGGVETCAFAAVLRKRPAAARCCMSLRAADLTTLMVAKYNVWGSLLPLALLALNGTSGLGFGLYWRSSPQVFASI
jgi:hypothetical protein